MGEVRSRQGRAFLSLVIVVFAFVGVLISSAVWSDAQTSDFSVDAGEYTIPNPDGTVEVSVRIDPKTSNLAGEAAVITYDKALVKPLSCNSVSGVGACNFSVPGEVRFDAVRAEGWANAFNATKIEFQALGVTGTARLGVQVPEAYDVDLAALNGSGIAGSITITQAQPSATLSNSCATDDGVFKLNLDNPTGAAVSFRTSVTGLPTRVKVVNAGSVSLETITGRPDGDYVVTVSADGTEILRSDETVKCDPPPAEVRLANSCLASNGRIDVFLNNTSASAQTYSVTVGSLLPKSTTVAAGAAGRVTVTGRPDGSYPVVVKRGATTIFSQSVVVDCDLDVEVAVKTSCLAQNGRIDTTLMNLTSAPHTYAVKVGPLAPRNRVLNAGESLTVTVTGRPDGALPVVVTRDGAQIYSGSENVKCDVVTPDKPVSVRMSCLAGSGRVDVSLGNTTSSPGTYKVEVGDLAPRFRTLAANATDRVTVTGRPDGPIAIAVYLGSNSIFSSTETVSCN